MKVTVLALAAAGLVAAQDFSGQPKCALECLEKYIPETGCDLDDTACQCQGGFQEKLLPKIAGCLTSACEAEDLIKAQNAAKQACIEFNKTADSSDAKKTATATKSDEKETATESGDEEETGTATDEEETTTLPITEVETSTVLPTVTDAATTSAPKNGTAKSDKPSKTSGGSDDSDSDSGDDDDDDSDSGSGSDATGTGTGTDSPASTETNAAAMVGPAAGLLAMFAAVLAL